MHTHPLLAGGRALALAVFLAVGGNAGSVGAQEALYYKDMPAPSEPTPPAVEGGVARAYAQATAPEPETAPASQATGYTDSSLHPAPQNTTLQPPASPPRRYLPLGAQERGTPPAVPPAPVTPAAAPADQAAAPASVITAPVAVPTPLPVTPAEPAPLRTAPADSRPAAPPAYGRYAPDAPAGQPPVVAPSPEPEPAEPSRGPIAPEPVSGQPYPPMQYVPYPNEWRTGEPSTVRPYPDQWPQTQPPPVPQGNFPSYPADEAPSGAEPANSVPSKPTAGKYGTNTWPTLDPELQVVAQDALGSLQGAIVAIDPSNGDIRALWDNPRKLALREIFPPGSTFKLVVAAAALESGKYNAKSEFSDPLELQVPQTDRTIMNIDKTPCTRKGKIDLFAAVKISCDTTFAQIGMAIHDEISDMAQAFGFNSAIPLPMYTAASQFPYVSDRNMPFRAYSGLGQGNVAATPLQMAVVAATIANGGRLVHPRLERDKPDEPSDARPKRVMSQQTAQLLTRMMVAAVDGGTGTNARIPGVKVAGKTGTAQHAPGADPHVWFVGFAPANAPKLAVCIFLRNGGEYGSEATGGIVAAPIARRILEADRDLRGW